MVIEMQVCEIRSWYYLKNDDDDEIDVIKKPCHNNFTFTVYDATPWLDDLWQIFMSVIE